MLNNDHVDKKESHHFSIRNKYKNRGNPTHNNFIVKSFPYLIVCYRHKKHEREGWDDMVLYIEPTFDEIDCCWSAKSENKLQNWILIPNSSCAWRRLKWRYKTFIRILLLLCSKKLQSLDVSLQQMI